MSGKFTARDAVWWSDPDDMRGDCAGWIVEGPRRNGTYGVIWINDSGGHGGAHEDDLRPRDDAGPVPAFVDEFIADEAAEARRARRRSTGKR